MRTLHIDTGVTMRGGQWQALYLVEGLVSQGLTVTLLAPAASPLFAEARHKGLDVRPLSLWGLRRLAGEVDVIHAHDAKAHTWAAMWGRAPLVVSRRVGFPIKSGLGSRWKYGRAQLFLAVSKYVANQLAKAGIAENRIRVVYDGVPMPPVSGRIPGQVVALAAKPVQISGVSVDHVSSQSGSFLEALRTASVFVYKSELEGLGSAALLAQAAGVPVVASAAGGLVEAVVDGHTGFVVEGDQFDKPVKRLLLDRGLAEKMGMAGRERVQREFSIDSMIAGTIRTYQELRR